MKNENDNNNKALFFRCLADLILIGVITSAIAAAVSYLFPIYGIIVIISSLSNGIFIILNLFRLFDFRLGVKSINTFYLHNFIATGIYCGAAVAYSLVMHFLNLPGGVISKIYTYLFYNFKIVHYISYNGNVYSIGFVTSALICTAVYFLIVLVFPLVINKNVKKKMLKKKDN